MILLLAGTSDARSLARKIKEHGMDVTATVVNERPTLDLIHPSVIPVESYLEAAEVAARKKGVILLTTGSKTLPLFAEKLLDLPDIRLITRVLPRTESLMVCEKTGFPQENIIAIQGPFSKELNKAIYRQFGVTLMITKESGQAGSVDEKVTAAIELGIETIMIKRPSIKYGTLYSQYDDVIRHLQRIREEDES